MGEREEERKDENKKKQGKRERSNPDSEFQVLSNDHQIVDD